jgi:hypothetical protein
MQPMLESYAAGQIDSRVLSQIVDQQLSGADSQKGKTRVLVRLLSFLRGCDLQTTDPYDLMIRYSRQLATVSDNPAEVLFALSLNASANKSLYYFAKNHPKTYLLAILSTEIAAAKMLSDHLVAPPGGGAVFGYCARTNDPDYVALIKEDKAQEIARGVYLKYDKWHGQWISIAMDLRAYKDELKLSDPAFARIWMDVAARDFKGNVADWPDPTTGITSD